MSTLKKLSGTVTPNYLPAVLKENKSGWLVRCFAEPLEHGLIVNSVNYG